MSSIAPSSLKYNLGGSWLENLKHEHNNWGLGAVAEFIHNSRDAKATRIEITTFPRPIGVKLPNATAQDGSKSIEITDNGIGMSSKDIDVLFQLHHQRGFESHKGIGGYGVGFKQGMISIAHTAVVISCSRENPSQMCFGLISNVEREVSGGGEKNPTIMIAVEDFWTGTDEVPSENPSGVRRNKVKDIQEFLHSKIKDDHGGALSRTIHLRAGRLKEKGGGTTVILLGIRAEQLEVDIEKEDIVDVRGLKGKDSNRPGAAPRVAKSLRKFCSVMFYERRIEICLLGKDVAMNGWQLSRQSQQPVSGQADGINVKGKIGIHEESKADHTYGIILYCEGILVDFYATKIGGEYGQKSMELNPSNNVKRAGVVLIVNLPKESGQRGNADYKAGIRPYKTKVGVNWDYGATMTYAAKEGLHRLLIQCFDDYCKKTVDVDAKEIVVAKRFIRDVKGRLEICKTQFNDKQIGHKTGENKPFPPKFWMPKTLEDKIDDIKKGLYGNTTDSKNAAACVKDKLMEVLNDELSKKSDWVKNALCDGYIGNIDNENSHNISDELVNDQALYEHDEWITIPYVVDQKSVDAAKDFSSEYGKDKDLMEFKAYAGKGFVTVRTVLAHKYNKDVAKHWHDRAWELNKNPYLKGLSELGLISSEGFKLGTQLLLPHKALISSWSEVYKLRNLIEGYYTRAVKESNPQTEIDEWIQCHKCKRYRKVSNENKKKFDQRYEEMQERGRTLEFACKSEFSPVHSDSDFTSCNDMRDIWEDDEQAGTEIATGIATDVPGEPEVVGIQLNSCDHCRRRTPTNALPLDAPHTRYKRQYGDDSIIVRSHRKSADTSYQISIFKAIDTAFGKDIIIKEFQPTHPEDKTCRQKTLAQCCKEALKLTQFSGIPKNICQMLFWCGFEHDEKGRPVQNPVIGMPYYGETLIDWSHERISSDGGEGKKFMQRLGAAVQIVNGVKELHTRNHVHCDIKPDNILVRRAHHQTNSECFAEDFIVTLIDFETVKLDKPTTNATRFSEQLATVKYLPPEYGEESKAEKDYREKRDLWALGITLLELFLGECWENALEPPITTENGVITEVKGTNRGKRIRELVKHTLSKRCKIRDLILSLLDNDPGARITAEKLHSKLEEICDKEADSCKFEELYGTPFVYRVHSIPDEEKKNYWNGISVPQGTGVKEIEEYVRNGSRKNYESQFLSCTRSLKWALHHYLLRKNEGVRDLRIIEIDMSKIGGQEYYDLSFSRAKVFRDSGFNSLTENFAVCAMEIVFEYKIPGPAITRIFNPTFEPKSNTQWRYMLNMIIDADRQLRAAVENIKWSSKSKAELTYKLMADRKGVKDADDFAHKVLDEMRTCSTCAKRPEAASTSSNGGVARKMTHACVRQARSPAVSNNKPQIANKRDSSHVDKACSVDDINFKKKKSTEDGGVNKRRLDEQNESENKRRKIKSKESEATDRAMTQKVCKKCGESGHMTSRSKKCKFFKPRKKIDTIALNVSRGGAVTAKPHALQAPSSAASTNKSQSADKRDSNRVDKACPANDVPSSTKKSVTNVAGKSNMIGSEGLILKRLKQAIEKCEHNDATKQIRALHNHPCSVEILRYIKHLKKNQEREVADAARKLFDHWRSIHDPKAKKKV